MRPSSLVFLAILVVVTLIMLGGTITLSVSRNVSFKKKLLPMYLATTAAGMLMLLAMITADVTALVMLGICFITVAVLQYHNVAFCDRCGGTTWGVLFGRSDCARCGAHFPSDRPSI